MNYNTLDAYTAARAAGDYLAYDEIESFDLDDVENLAPLPEAPAHLTISKRGLFTSKSLTLSAKLVAETSRSVFLTTDSPTKLEITWRWGSASTSTVGDRIVSELGRIKDGWAGEGTVAPTNQIVTDVESAIERLPVFAKMPAIEIDEEDGTVALRWLAQDRNSSLSLVFRGNKRVTGVFATIAPPRSTTWSFSVSEEIQIAKQFDEPTVRQLIVG
jgi:hypothetical protein